VIFPRLFDDGYPMLAINIYYLAYLIFNSESNERFGNLLEANSIRRRLSYISLITFDLRIPKKDQIHTLLNLFINKYNSTDARQLQG